MLPKLQKKSLIDLCQELILEKYTFFNISDYLSVALCYCDKDKILFTNQLYQKFVQDFPHVDFFSFKHRTSMSFQDIHKKERIFQITVQSVDEYDFVCIYELTDLFQSKNYQQTQDSLNALENLAAGISHEIKNPLSAIDIHTQLLEHKINSKKISVPQEVKSYLSIVQKESKRLLDILDMFLDRTRKHVPNLVFTEVGDIIESIEKLLTPELQLKKISLFIQKSTIPKIFTAPHLLQQILLDLLRNAIESVEETSKERKIWISYKESSVKDGIVIAIDDAGQGIDPALKHKIFDPYFTTKPHGTGLGLTLVKKMINELGGQIFLETSEWGGAKFVVYLSISQEHQKLLN